MQPLSGPRGFSDGVRHHDLTSSDSLKTKPLQSEALTSTQRTALERIIVKILAISSLKAPALWAGIRHHLNVSNEGELLSSQFADAEKWLEEILKQEQHNHLARRQLQQLTELLPQGNNRQAVSEYIRHQFGQTVLSALTQAQLQQVLTRLQQGEISIPHPVQTHATARSLLPAEHLTLSQQVVKLSVANGESTISVWETLHTMVGLKNGDPIPVKHYPLLMQYLQARQQLVGQQPMSLQQLFQGLKQPASLEETQQAASYCEQYYQLTTMSLLSTVQAQDILNALFSYRAGFGWASMQSRLASGPIPIQHAAPSESDKASYTPFSGRIKATLVVVALLLLIFWWW
ncbi:flagella biosynthesis regulator Flk [Rosenbergiella australiborealis]|uniref:flagella biosynthesis regulator Flk n=1 Tax=Rosenbergiella australiborealis TaxID=1544696 RepID=UPI001F4E6FC3|nr:flagella biosynthesis regulator Flk [Rosenbergiella australiborealis]